MKRLLSICFACILLFNLCGYRLLIDYLEQRQQAAVATQINQGVDEAALISIKVPAALPYYTNSADFQWIRGEVQIKGTVYQYVKRRIYNDSIEYQCMADRGKTELVNARDRFFELAHDLQQARQKTGSTSISIKPLLLEYDGPDAIFAGLTLADEATHYDCAIAAVLPQAFIQLPAQPPEALA